jgi:hypothetical protein
MIFTSWCGHGKCGSSFLPGARAKKEQGTCQKISCSVVPPVGGGYSVLKV